MCSDVPQHCLTTLRVLVSRKKLSRSPYLLLNPAPEDSDLICCPSALTLADSAVEGVSSSSSTKDVGSSSPLTDRKKHRRKKSMNQKGDAASGQADGKRALEGVFRVQITVKQTHTRTHVKLV